MLKNFLKKILPTVIVSSIRNYRKKNRFAKRFSYNEGKSFFKTIHTEGITFDILIDPFLNSGVDETIAETGIWEQKIAKQIKNILPKDGVFIDIGANIGYHSLLASKILSGGGHIYSFEPQHSIYLQLLKSVEKNNLKNITVYNTALSDRVGSETLYIREENSGGSTLLSLPVMESFQVGSRVSVELATLDSFLENFPSVDLIKIDVEGYEYEVFRGAQKLLEKYHPTIIMEFSPVFYVQDYTEKSGNLVNFLSNKGYRFFDMDDKEIDLNNWLKELENSNSQIDIICKYS